MTPKIKNILIFVTIGAVFVFIYFFFIRSSAPTPSLVASTSDATATDGTATDSSTSNTAITQNFLSTLLGVNNIKLDTTILSDPAFISLHDSTVLLTPDPNPGRPNPFAQFGDDTPPPTDTTGIIPVNSTTSSATVAPTLPTVGLPAAASTTGGTTGAN